LKTAVRWGWLRLRRRNHEEKYPAVHPTARSGERRELPIGVPEESRSSIFDAYRMVIVTEHLLVEG